MDTHPSTIIDLLLSALRVVDPDAYTQIIISSFSTPPQYALEDLQSDWWGGDSCRSFILELAEQLEVTVCQK